MKKIYHKLLKLVVLLLHQMMTKKFLGMKKVVSPHLSFSGPPSSLNPGSRPLPSLSSSITYIHPFPAVLNHRNAKFLTPSFINVVSLSSL